MTKKKPKHLTIRQFLERGARTKCPEWVCECVYHRSAYCESLAAGVGYSDIALLGQELLSTALFYAALNTDGIDIDELLSRPELQAELNRSPIAEAAKCR